MDQEFFVVAIGASAGGLKALEAFLSEIEREPGVAFVIIQHLKRDYTSNLDQILGRKTKLPVKKIEDGERLMPNRVYVIPENYNVTLHDRIFKLQHRSPSELINNSINIFFESVSKDVGDKVIGIVMSGTGSDGTKGLHAIEDYGGITIVQDPETAEFDGMPNHSIKFDHPTYILAPKDMVGCIQTIVEEKFKQDMFHANGNHKKNRI